MIYNAIGRVLPKPLVEKYKEMLFYANIKVSPLKLTGFLFSFGVMASLIIAWDLNMIFSFPFWLVFLLSFFCIEVFAYLWMLMRADARAKFIEDMLPDALQIMASNLRAGFTTDKALLISSRPEFGPLKEELDIVAKEVMTGQDMGRALVSMTKRVKSEKFEKAILLIVTGLSSGGELAPLISDTAKGLIEQKFVEAMVRSSILTYVIFIFAAVGFGAPVLYGLSSFLVEVLTKVISTVNIPESAAVGMAGMPLAIKAVSISSEFIIAYSIISLVTTSVMASFVIGLISKGKEKEGLTKIPVLVLLTMTVFLIVRHVISSLLSGLFLI